MKDLTYYTNVGPHPKKDDYKLYHVYSNGQVLYANVSPAQAAIDRKSWQDNGYVIECVMDENAYRVARQANNGKRSRLMTEFRDDLFAANGVSGNPKAQKAYDIAYAERHSGGLQEVADFFEDLAELIK